MNAPLSISMPVGASSGPRSYKLLIDGRFVDASDGRTIDRTSPGHGFAVSRYAHAGRAEVEAAAQAAHRAFETDPWPRMKAGELGEILLEAGLPAGVVNIVAGFGADVGAPLVSHPLVEMVSFTGSTRVGKLTMASAANSLKKVSMELGGKNGQIVFPDADLDAAVDAAVFGGFFNAGECCNAGSRLIVHEDIAEDFLASVKALTVKLRVGDPLDVRTKVGAIISADHLEKVSGYVAAAQGEGGSVLAGGAARASNAGQYLEPTIVSSVTEVMSIAREEVFGPVLSVLTFKSIERALHIANDTPYGLSAGVWSASIDTCMTIARGVRSGTVWVNTFMEGYPELPFGGYKQSGLGRELGKRAVEDYTEEKTIQFHRGARTGWWVG